MEYQSKPISPSKLRANIYKYLDDVALKGKTLEIKRHGLILQLSPPKGKSVLDAFRKKRKLIIGNPEDLVNISWEKEWKPDPL